ncbi:hypothetical protein O9992_29670 [Vibrio lentus]|nr:hypothetical protein [Vibrio lentus]
MTDGVKTEFEEPLKADASFNELIYSGVPLESDKEVSLQEASLECN